MLGKMGKKNKTDSSAASARRSVKARRGTVAEDVGGSLVGVRVRRPDRFFGKGQGAWGGAGQTHRGITREETAGNPS